MLLDPQHQADLESNQVHFNGLSFNLNNDRTKPTAIRDVFYTQNKNLIKFLDILKSTGLLDAVNRLPGLVIYADDQYVNQQIMQLNF